MTMIIRMIFIMVNTRECIEISLCWFHALYVYRHIYNILSIIVSEWEVSKKGSPLNNCTETDKAASLGSCNIFL